MTKQIAGMILFSLIVGTSVLIAGLSNTERTVDIESNVRVFKSEKKRKRKKRRCRPHRRASDLPIERAVFSRQTGLLSTTFGDAGEAGSHGTVELHFFSKDRHGTRFLKTESIGYGGVNAKHFEPLEWLKRIDESQYIYVSATVNKYPSRWSTPPRFDATKAVPVLVSDE